MIRTHRAALAPLLLALCVPALAQTPLGGGKPVPMTPPGKTQAGKPPPPAPPSQSPSTPMVPLSDSAHRQAINQSEGVFPEMDRAAGGQIQEAWNISEARDGIYVTRLCDNCVYKVRTRELMTTTLVLPEDTQVATIDLGDPIGFRSQVRSANMIAVRPSAYGLDTNLNVYTKSGRVYPFYIRSESFNSIHVPDLLVKILGRETPEVITGEVVAAKAPPVKPGNPVIAASVDALSNPGPAKGDFVRTVPFDPAKLHGWKDYKLWGDDELAPEVIFRDDFFTYIRYGKKWDGMELSTAYVTNDGIDELVNSRVSGSTFIVESVRPLITLKNGKKFLCVQYKGETP